MIPPPMRPRLPFSLWPFLSLAAVLLGLAAAAPSPDRPPPGDSATHPLIAFSLLHDRDLVWDERDHARAYRLWNAGPDGLALTESPDGTLRYARPIAYPLALLPFLPLGPAAPAVLNTVLLLSMLLTALCLHAAPSEALSSPAAEPRGPGRVALSQGRQTARPRERDARLRRSRAESDEGSAEPHPLTQSAARPLGEGDPPRPAPGATNRPAGPYPRPVPAPENLPWLPALFVLGSFLLSFTLAQTWRPEPNLFEAAGVFFPFALALALRHNRLHTSLRSHTLLALAAGLLLGAAITSAPPLVLFAAVALALLASGRRWRTLAALAAGALVAAGLLTAAEHRLAARWSAWQPGVEQLTFRGAFPGDRATGAGAAIERPPEPGPVRTAGRLARESWWLLAGRHGGALPFFPFTVLALVLALAGPLDRNRALLLTAALALTAWMLLAPPVSLAGGGVFTGHRWLAVLAPVLVLLPSPALFRRGATSGGRLAAVGTASAFAAAAIWTVPALASALAGTIASAPAPAAPAHLRLASFRALPLELSLLPRLPGYELRSWGQGSWAFPLGAVYAAEGHPQGVWLRGGAEAELVMASPEPLETIAFTAFSPLPDNVLTAGGGSEEVIVRFDSPGKRAGVPIELPVEPVARGLGFFPRAPDDVFYRVTVSTTHGWVPARRDPGSADPRYLSTFLSFTGEPP